MSFMITDFSDFINHQWKVVNDGVMGGFSSSQLQIQSDGHALFLGVLTTANNGGFASVKNIHSINLKDFNTFVLRVKGDGKQYSFRFKTAHDKKINEWSYESRFWTISGQWQTIELPIHDFYPVYRGRILNNMPKPDLANIKEYGLMVSNRQEGRFQIEIQYLEAVNRNYTD